MNSAHWLLAAALAAIGSPAMAADQPAPAPADQAQQADPGALGEIVVTATRRETNLQDTPIAISAIDRSLITQSTPRDIGDLSIYVPNFSAARITGFNAASFAMRGLGQNNIIVYFESPVAVLVDDFVVPSVQTQLLDTFDIDQVEVLRGPQGTLFGRNTTAGAVSVRTIRPDTDSFGAQGRVIYGDFDSIRVQGAINVPIVRDKLALRVVGGYDYSNGFVRNGARFGPVTPFAPSKFAGVRGQGDGERLGGFDTFAGRAKLLWTPSPSARILAQYEIIRDRSEAPIPIQETPPGPNFVFNLLGVGAQGGGDVLDRGGSTQRNGNLVNVGDGHPVDVNGYYLNMDFDIGPGTLSLVTGYREQNSKLSSTYTGVVPVAPDGEILSLFDANRQDQRETFQQEIRYAGKIGDRFDFVAGGFYQHEDIDFCVAQLLGFLDLLGTPGLPGGFNNNPFTLCNAQRSQSYAVFTEGNLKLTDKLTFTAGGRYSWDEKTWFGRQQVFPQQLNGGFDPTLTAARFQNPLDLSVYNFGEGVVRVDESWAEPTWRFSLSYQATDRIFGYFTYSHGYKSGGFNDQIGTFAPFGGNLAAFRLAASPTNPEFADSYEVGVKTELFDRRLRLNVTGFYVDYSDLQKQIVVPIVVDGQPFQVTRFFNAASATVKGIEAEATALLFDGFTLRGVLGYQHAQYNEYNTPIPAGYDLASAPLDRAPDWQWTLDGAYTTNVGRGKLTLNMNANYVARNLFTQSIDRPEDNTFLNARTLVNASITLATQDDRYYVRGFVRNLLDERFRTASQTVGGLWTFTLYGEPQFFGVELGARFGGR